MSRITPNKAREIVESELVRENEISLKRCSEILGYHENTLLKYARISADHKRDGIDDPDDFPAFQLVPKGKYKILFTDFKEWCNRKGFRI